MILTRSCVHQEHNHVSLSDPAPAPSSLMQEEWKTGLFAVTAEPGGAGLCLKATFCPCIVFGETVGRLTPQDVMCGGNKIGAALFYYLCGLLAALPTRLAIRQKYAVRGSVLTDILATLCCTCCAIIQVGALAVYFGWLMRRLMSSGMPGSKWGLLGPNRITTTLAVPVDVAASASVLQTVPVSLAVSPPPPAPSSPLPSPRLRLSDLNLFRVSLTLTRRRCRRQEHNHVFSAEPAPAPTPPPASSAPAPPGDERRVDETDAWSSGLFDVAGQPGGVSLALLAACCPCVVYGKTIGQLKPGEATCAGSAGMASCCYLSLGPIAHCMSRPAIRKKYNIGGSFVQDCCTIYLCGCCALIQVA